MDELNKFLPAVWSHNNPIDVIGDASAELYAKTLEVAGRDPNSDGLLVILTPQAMTDATATAEKLKAFGHIEGKPVLASWMGGDEVAAGEAILNRADIPTFAYPDTAAMVFTSMWQYSENLRALYETPVPSADPADLESGRAKAHKLIEAVKKAGRTILTEAESKDLLGCYGIPTVITKIAKTEAAAAKLAKEIGFPIRAEALLRDHHPQDRRRRRPVEPQGRSRRAQSLQRHQDLGDREEGRRTLPGRHRAEDDQAGRRLRDHPGQQH